MRGGQGQIEEEGAFVLRVTVDVVYCAVSQVGQTVLVVEVVGYGTCTPEARFLSCGYGTYLSGGGLAVFYIYIGGHVEGAAEAVEIVEA